MSQIHRMSRIQTTILMALVVTTCCWIGDSHYSLGRCFTNEGSGHGTIKKKKRIAFAPFEIDMNNVSAAQVQGAFDAVASNNKHFRLLPSMSKLKSVSDVEDLSEIEWDDSQPDYVMINSSIYLRNELVVIQGTMASTKADSIGFIQAYGKDIDDAVEEFWKQIDRPVEDIGVPALYGTWLDEKSNRKILVSQFGSNVFGRVVSSPGRLLKDKDWCYFEGKISRDDDGWLMKASFSHRGTDYMSWSGYQETAEIRHRIKEIEFAETNWLRVNETPKQAYGKIKDLQKSASKLSRDIRTYTASDKADVKNDLAYKLAKLEIRIARALSAQLDEVDQYQRGLINQATWKLESYARKKHIPGAGLIAGMPIIGDWNVQSGKLGKNAVFGLKARFIVEPGTVDQFDQKQKKWVKVSAMVSYVKYDYWTRERSDRPGTSHSIKGSPERSLYMKVGGFGFARLNESARAQEFFSGLRMSPVRSASDGSPQLEITKSWVDEKGIGQSGVSNVLKQIE